MATTLQVVDPESLTSVVFDLNDTTGVNSALYGGVSTFLLSDVNIGQPKLEATNVEDRNTDFTRATAFRQGLAQMKFRMRMTATSYDNLTTAVGKLAHHFGRGCVLKWIPDGSSVTRYIDVNPSVTPVILDGRELGMFEVAQLFQTNQGVLIQLDRLPYLRGDALTPGLNLLDNPTMLRDSNDDGTPENWTVGATSPSINSSFDAWQGTLAAAGTYASQDFTGTGTYALSWEVWKTATTADTVEMRLLSQPSGTVIGTSTVTTTPQRLSVTGTVQGGDTGVRCQIRLTAGTAGTTIRARNAQLETGSTASPFRVKAQTVVLEPDASGFARIIPVYNPGNAPAPCSIVQAFPDANTAATDFLFGLAITSGIQGTGRLADWLNVTHYAQADATRNGWTVALGTDTSAVAGAGSSTTNVARITHATAITDMTKRITISRTTRLDSLRGEHDVWMRCKAGAAQRFVAQLRWSPANATPAVYAEDEVFHDTTDSGSGGSWVTLRLGTIRIPEETDIAVGQVTFEIWTRMKSGAAANLDVDYIAFAPSRGATASAPDGDATTYLGSELQTPVANPAGGTAGLARDELLFLNTTTDNCGSAGINQTGHHRVRFKMGSGANADRTVLLRIRNTTDSTDTRTKTVTVPANTNNMRRWLSFDAVTAKAYRAQVDDPSAVNTTDVTRNIFVRSIRDVFVPAVTQNERLRTDPGSRPGRDNVEKLDSSGNLVGEYDSTDVPFLIPPGLSMIYLDNWDAEALGYDEPVSVIGRTMTVTPTVYPRYRG